MRETLWQKNVYRCICQFIGIVAAAVLNMTSPVLAQDASTPSIQAVENYEDQDQLARLQSIGLLIETKRIQRDELTAALKDSLDGAMQDERDRLSAVIRDLTSLRSSFERALLQDVDTQLMAGKENPQFDWRNELLEVVEPLLISLKSMTKRPRQLAELRNVIDLDSQKLVVAEQALQTIEKLSGQSLNEGAAARLQAAREKWDDAYNLVNESLEISRAQLSRLQKNENSFTDSFVEQVKNFITGRGLTLSIAALAAAIVCLLMRLCWHVFNTRLTKRSVRRKATWYRLLAYSYHLLTLIVVVGTVMGVLYLRQDVLLMGLALLVVAAAIISLRTFLPRFLSEVRLLLNLGAVREGECVIHAGLPWQIMSLNMLTVLRNPALEGIIRLPLNVMTLKVSKPIVRSELWFPTQRGDYILLPEGTFGQVMSQTTELVKLRVKGGMSMTIPTAEFYSMNVMNLSGDETFGIAVTFGLDYSLQQLSLTTVPEKLKSGILLRLQEAQFEFGKDITNVLVEFKQAGASSLDFLIYTSVKSDRAADFYALERLVQQACVAVSNEQQWMIPFAQMTLHHQSVGQPLPVYFQKAA